MSSALLSREQFVEELEKKKEVSMDEWNVDLYRCPRCNGAVKRDYSVMYTSNPPKYRYFCRNCSYSEVM